MNNITPGHNHPTLMLLDEAINYFKLHNFEIALGPEVETEWYNFDFLRVASDHPSRDVQDTFWLKDGKVLRTQTTSVQGRVTDQWNINPPLRVISPGKVYRNETTDATHEAVFFQLEGFVIDKNITMGNLIWIVDDMLKKILNISEVKFYPHYFPYTEPSMEVTVKWKNKWLEVMGCGMIHPEVIRNMNLDPNVYKGLAFGFGADRLAMLKYGIDDLRLLHHPDLRMINQF